MRQLALKLLIRDQFERVEGTLSSVVQMVGPMAKCSDLSSLFFNTGLETSIVLLAFDVLTATSSVFSSSNSEDVGCIIEGSLLCHHDG